MKNKRNLAKLFPPKKIKEVDKILLSALKAVKIPKEDERIKLILNDPYCPNTSFIQGVYFIYKKSVLELLEGRIPTIHSYEFMETQKNDRTISAEDIDYVLEMATAVVIASEEGETMTDFFIGGSAEKLNNILYLCQGYSKELEKQKNKESLQGFMKDIKIVEQMGLLEEVIGNE
ncbi:hypothetical protein MM221_13595 [Salipaludibacillus sp. LMS25]|jgi:hypothetical protein|uniref:hypothetical protein n=1 Tax=Salipaludibacillus sp. LMS25 TaxID=2924031 RepID=UPI0020D045F9|nr:hypothetical protein [Salipaludibacillus sp. LMS25]UTR13648.1 hypothetical protein MM221_13595 [Salipaludibacillus sp. LMS25]